MGPNATPAGALLVSTAAQAAAYTPALTGTGAPNPVGLGSVAPKISPAPVTPAGSYTGTSKVSAADAAALAKSEKAGATI